MAEQLRLEQRVGNSGAVDGDKRHRRAIAQRVQRPGEQLLAGSALAFDEHRRIRVGGALQRREHLPQGRVFADDLRSAAADGQLLLHQQVLVGDAALLERTVHEEQQMIGIDGLGEKVHRAVLHRPHCVLDAAVGGHDDHRYVGVDVLGRAQHAEAVAVGQPQVRQHERRLRVLEEPDRGWLVAGLDDLIALPLEGVPQHRSERVLVLDDENAGGCGQADAGQRSQPGGTLARRASSSISAIFFRLASTSAFTRSSSSIALARSSPIFAR